MTTHLDSGNDAPRLYKKATDNMSRYLSAVQTSQWEDATPCTDWNVRQLVNHFVSGAKNVKSIMEGTGPQDFGDNVLGDDPLAAFNAAVEKALAEIEVPGAMGTEVTTRRGEQSAGDYVLGQVQEMAVHGWDLAKATGQDTAIDPELVEVGLARVMANRERLRTAGVFGEAEAPFADDADPQTRYLGILGRSA
jgi:uncharacterized protein (TIGR03086 family)